MFFQFFSYHPSMAPFTEILPVLGPSAAVGAHSSPDVLGPYRRIHHGWNMTWEAHTMKHWGIKIWKKYDVGMIIDVESDYHQKFVFTFWNIWFIYDVYIYVNIYIYTNAIHQTNWVSRVPSGVISTPASLCEWNVANNINKHLPRHSLTA